MKTGSEKTLGTKGKISYGGMLVKIKDFNNSGFGSG